MWSGNKTTTLHRCKKQNDIDGVKKLQAYLNLGISCKVLFILYIENFIVSLIDDIDVYDRDTYYTEICNIDISLF